MEKNNFVKKMLTLANIYGKKEGLDKTTLDMYYMALSSQLNDNQFESAVKEILLTRKYGNFPTPAEFIEVIKGDKEQQGKVKILEAEAKFKKILNSGRSIKCDDWAIHSTIKKMGGLEELRRSKKQDEKWLLKEFKEKYEIESTKKNVGTEIPKILYTKRDIQNLENKMPVMPVLIIGDEKKWEKWTKALNDKIGTDSGAKKIMNLADMKAV